MSESLDRIHALDYMQKTGMSVNDAARMIRSIVNLGNGGMMVTIEISGLGMPRNSVTIDREKIQAAKSILRGLKALKNQPPGAARR